MRPLDVVDEQRPGRYPSAHGLPHARRAGLPAAADYRDRVLVDVDDDADAQLLAGQAALPGLPVALGEVGVVPPVIFRCGLLARRADRSGHVCCFVGLSYLIELQTSADDASGAYALTAKVDLQHNRVIGLDY